MSAPAARALAAVIMLAAILATSACKSDPDDRPTTASPTPLMSPTVDPREQEAKDKVLATFDAAQNAYVAAAATANYRSPDLGKHTADPLLGERRFTLQQQSGQGIVHQGRPTWTSQIKVLNLTTKPYSATIETCLDTTNWRAIYKATGKSAEAPGQATRYIVNSTALLYDDGRWLISEARADRSRSC